MFREERLGDRALLCLITVQHTIAITAFVGSVWSNMP